MRGEETRKGKEVFFLQSDDVLCYLQQSVHIRLHVRDGHPLHDDVSDTSLQ